MVFTQFLVVGEQRIALEMPVVVVIGRCRTDGVAGSLVVCLEIVLDTLRAEVEEGGGEKTSPGRMSQVAAVWKVVL